MWTAIVLTCQNSGTSKVYQSELDSLKRKGLFPENVPVIAVEDPGQGLGSGGSTLNALLIVTELLCAKNGYTVLRPEIISEATILIIHTGRTFIFDPCGRAFIDLPAVTVTRSGREIRLTSFVHLYLTVTEQLLQTCASNVSYPSCGLWVCGSDSMLVLDPAVRYDDPLPVATEDILAFTFPVSTSLASYHGVYQLDELNNYVNDVIYQGEADQLKRCHVTGHGDSVPLVIAMLYMSPKVADSLLRLHSVYPLNCSTYLGQDSGALGFKLSLFFDFLLPTCCHVTENDFVGGVRGGPKGMPGKPQIASDQCEARDTFLDVMPLARQLIWSALRNFKTKAVFLKPLYYHYFTDIPGEFFTFLRDIHEPLSKIPNYKVWKRPIINSFSNSFHSKCKCLLYNCCLSSKCEDGCSIGEAQYCCDQSSAAFCFFDNSTPTTRDSNFSKKYNVNLYVDFENQTGITSPYDTCGLDADKIPFDLTQTNFLINGENYNLHKSNNNEETLRCWSPNKIVQFLDVQRCFDFKKQIYCLLALDFVRQALLENRDVCLFPIFSTLCVDNYANELLNVLDNVTETCGSSGISARTLSCIADVLSLLASGNGGLRSGPALHKDWMPIFNVLENGDSSSGFKLLTKLRTTWMHNPFAVIRAARHYEAAAQIFMRKTMKQIKSHINIDARSFAKTPDFETVFGAKAAARIDMAGGWSDTPPITYEHGGAVLNVAIQIDGKKPLGAKTKRIDKPLIKAYCISSLDDRKEIVVAFRTMADIRNYANPSAPGALVAAVLVFAQIVDPCQDEHGEIALANQLTSKFGGGFKIYYWSDLPQGSGLGTSSILAGCILASVWRAVGVRYTVNDILHAVLYIEQLLTTGGGWQDQVGGLCPGVKIGRFCSLKQGEPKITVETCDLSAETYQWLNDRFLLVYTGKTRLAKNLLQEVVRSWYARKPDVVETVRNLVVNAELCKLALERGDWDTVAECTRTYWSQKKFMAPGSEPPVVAALLKNLYEKHLIYTGWLAGAGGGGFLYLITRQPNVEHILKDLFVNDDTLKDMSVHKVMIDMNPFEFFTE